MDVVSALYASIVLSGLGCILCLGYGVWLYLGGSADPDRENQARSLHRSPRPRPKIQA